MREVRQSNHIASIKEFITLTQTHYIIHLYDRAMAVDSFSSGIEHIVNTLSTIVCDIKHSKSCNIQWCKSLRDCVFIFRKSNC